MNKVATFQIGKAGITPTVCATLSRMLETHKFIRISALPASGRNRDSIKHMAEQLVHNLTEPCSTSIIGFTIVLRKHAARKEKALKKSTI